MSTVLDKKIAAIDWTKRWAGAFSLLSSSYFGQQYTTICNNVFGVGFKNVFFAHKNGTTTCYRSKVETSIFGEHLVAQCLVNPKLLDTWANELKTNTDAIKKFITLPPAIFLDFKNFSKFETMFEKYGPAQFAVTTLPNFLPPHLLDSHLHILEDARRYSESVYNETEEFFRKLCDTIGQKNNSDGIFIGCLYRNEFKDYITSHVLPPLATLQRRYFQSGLYCTAFNQVILDKNQTIELENVIASKNGLVPGFAKGTAASKGVVRGVVRIVSDPRKVTLFNNGDILITGMTRPDFVPLMKKSGAIVTDAGGLLCHAAIVSRELGKPCVIATEVATKAFNEGDLVEVDANTGEVRKI